MLIPLTGTETTFEDAKKLILSPAPFANAYSPHGDGNAIVAHIMPNNKLILFHCFKKKIFFALERFKLTLFLFLDWNEQLVDVGNCHFPFWLCS